MIVWRAGDWQVECDPQGGRLTRVRWRGRDLLTRPHLPGGVFTPPAPKWGEYETSPVFGYDDCWPSLEVSDWPSRGRDVRDHGELCWLQWAVGATYEALTATATDPAGEWRFARVLSCVEGALRFDFNCVNTGARPLAMSWAGHALTPTSGVRDLALPACVAVRQDFPVSAELPAAGVWPHLCGLPEGTALMLVLTDCQSPVVSVNLDGLCWTLKLSGADRPALGLWYNRRGYPPGEGLARDEFGIEWMLTPECLLKDAVSHGSAWILAPGESRWWSVTWTIEEIP